MLTNSMVSMKSFEIKGHSNIFCGIYKYSPMGDGDINIVTVVVINYSINTAYWNTVKSG